MSIKKIHEEYKILCENRWEISKKKTIQYEINSGENCEKSLLDIIQERRQSLININLQELNNRIDELEACVKFSNRILYIFDLKNNTVVLDNGYEYFRKYADFITEIMLDEHIEVDFDDNTKEITAIFGPEYMH